MMIIYYNFRTEEGLHYRNIIEKFNKLRWNLKNLSRGLNPPKSGLN